MSEAPMVCARCGVKLKPQRWVYSTFTKERYCPAGECKGERRTTKRKATVAA